MNLPDRRRRPSAPPDRLAQLLVDLVIAVASYPLAYRIRFAGPQFHGFLPYALKTLPIVVGAQMLVLVACRVYSAEKTRIALRRLLIGTSIGTMLGAALVFWFQGLTGVSRAAFSADWLLLATALAGWRTGRALWYLQSNRSAVKGLMIDRAAERPNLGDTFVSLIRYRELIKNLVMKDLKLKYRGSVLGFLWSLVNPIVMITVYTLAFTFVMRTAVHGFVFFLLLGLLAWTFFASAAAMSTGAIIDSGNLMKSVSFPRAILPIAAVIFNLTQYLLTVLVLLPIMLTVYRVVPSAPMILYPVFVTLQVLFTIGVAFLLAAGTAFFRDTRHLLDIALSALFWLTPILYPLTQVPEKLRLLILLSPLSPFVVAYQQMFFYQQWPSFTVWAVGLVYSIGTFLLGAWLFLSLEDRLAEQL
jgi:ABC-2 type transport system permease protein